MGQGTLLQIIFAYGCLAFGAARAANCLPCQKDHERLQQATQKRQKLEALLAKNKAFQAKIGASDVSKSIKIKSNILLISTELMTLENVSAVLTKNLSRKECKGCIR